MLKYMPSINVIEHIEFPREEVYAAGIQTETWPDINGLVIEPDAPTVALGGLIRARLNLPGIRLGLDCAVTDLVPNELVHIEGKSRTARALLHFELSDDDKNGGTQIEYTFGLEPKTLIAKAATPAIRVFIEKSVPEFAKDFKQNIIEHIGKDIITP